MNLYACRYRRFDDQQAGANRRVFLAQHAGVGV
jgi:hypothetical protein